MIVFVCTENAGEALPAIKWNPCKLTAVIVKEAGSKADSASCSNVGECRIVIRTVEIFDFSAADESVLDRTESRRRSASDHERSSVEIGFMN